MNPTPRYSLRTLLILLAIGPPLVAGLRLWYLDWLPGHKAEVAYKRAGGLPVPLITHVIEFFDPKAYDFRP